MNFLRSLVAVLIFSTLAVAQAPGPQVTLPPTGHPGLDKNRAARTNDIAGNSGPISNEDIEANLASMAELARAHAIRMIFASILPVNNYTPVSQEFFASRPPERILALNSWVKDYCARNDLTYLDYFDAMLDDKGLLKRDLADDGLHPNKAGFAVMAPLAEKAIEKNLQPVAP